MKELLTPEERHAWDTWWATHPKDAAQNAAFLRERTVRTLDWNDRVTTRFMSMEAEARAREPRSDRLPRPFASQKLLDFIDAARTASTGSVKLQQLLGDVEQLNNSGTQPGARAAQPLVRRLGELHTAFGGPVTATGWRIYAPHPYDTGIAVHGPGIPGFLLNSTAGPVGGGAAPLNIDLEREVAKVIDDPEQQLTDTERWTNLSTFAADGGKQLFYHGMSDPWFSAFDTIGYYGVQVA
ncbi:MAG: hypothetical protein ACREUT_17570 [Steroidobacteraceae bacterium]